MCSSSLTDVGRPVNQVTAVQYNRAERQWEAVNGRTWLFPAGPSGKRQAQLYALDHDVPLVADEVKAIMARAQASNPNSTEAEAITRRAIKAGFLVRDGHVLPPRPFDADGSYLNEIARVRSSQKWPDGSAVEYAVNQPTRHEVWCECPDFKEGAPTLPSGQKACKHVLAVLICEALDLDLETPPQRIGPRSEALEAAIEQAEAAHHELGNLLMAMRLTRDNLTPEMVDLLAESLHPVTQTNGKLCFAFEVDWDGIHDELDAQKRREELV